MKMSFRWYGDSDPISLEYISQIPGMRSVVSAVYDVKPGEVWPEESLAKMKAECEEHGLVFDVVESIPVSEDIKLGTEKRDEHIDVYCENIRRCAKYGIKCVTYNFMPVFDWTRTQLDKEAPDGSTSLVMYWDQMKGLDPLKDDINLPGWDASYTQDEVRGLIQAYGELGEEGLWKNIEIFLKKVIPVAEECGVVMALHPDDPPIDRLCGYPRILTSAAAFRRALALAASPNCGVTFCQANFRAMGEDVFALAQEFCRKKKLFFFHFRDIEGSAEHFHETFHDNGPTDMPALLALLRANGFDGLVRPDHTPTLAGERNDNPGYEMLGNLFAVGYIRGILDTLNLK